MKTRVFSAALAVRIVIAALVQLSTCYVIAEDDGTTSSPQQIDKAFVRHRFREFIGKFRYGRVVLTHGATSQTIVLTDLLPPEPSPTPVPTSGDSSAPSQ
jgi:hypothetical protein